MSVGLCMPSSLGAVGVWGEPGPIISDLAGEIPWESVNAVMEVTILGPQKL